MNNGKKGINMKRIAILTVCLLSALSLTNLGAAEIKACTDDNKIFEFEASNSPEIANLGGNVKGEFSSPDSSISFDNGSMLFKYPAKGILAFPSAGNLSANEGTVIFELSYAFDGDAEISELKEKDKWSQLHSIFYSPENSGGFRFFFETQKIMKPGSLRLTVMNAREAHKWAYYGVNIKKADFPQDKFFSCGFSWKNNELAIIANGQIVYKETMKEAPLFGKKLIFGESGTYSFSGRIKSVQIYNKAAF